MGGKKVANVQPDMNCVNSIIKEFTVDSCPFELRVYSDQVPGSSTPTLSIDGVDTETSPCFTTPLDLSCRKAYAGCRSICKALDEGWIGHYIDTVKGNQNVVDPFVTLLDGTRLRWSEQVKVEVEGSSV